MKQCAKCAETKQDTAFYASSRGRLEASCKRCRNRAKLLRGKVVGSPAWLKVRYYRLRRKAQSRGIPFLLTRTDVLTLLQTKECSYCSDELSVSGPCTFNTLSVDRIDNRLGYTLVNTTAACFRCNCLKGRLEARDYWRCAEVLLATIRRCRQENIAPLEQP